MAWQWMSVAHWADEPVEACPPSRTYRVRKFVFMRALDVAAQISARGTCRWRTSLHRLVRQVASHVRRQAIGRLVAPGRPSPAPS